MARMILRPTLFCLLALGIVHAASPYPEKTPDTPANRALNQYWALQAQHVHAHGSLDGEGFGAADWMVGRAETRRQLAEMLGLDPMPARTPLNVVKTGEVKGDGFVVEKLYFQSMPGLYVTANFYRPETVEKRLPTILYVSAWATRRTTITTGCGSRATATPASSSIRCSSARSRASTTALTTWASGGGWRAVTRLPESRLGTACARSIIWRRALRWTRHALA